MKRYVTVFVQSVVNGVMQVTPVLNLKLSIIDIAIPLVSSLSTQSVYDFRTIHI